MAVSCCHPILAWIANLLLTIISGFISLVVVFTTISGRPKAYGAHYRPEIVLTTHEELLLSHAAFLVVSAVVVQKTLSLISCGEHRDERFRIEKAFIILSVFVTTLSLLNLILVVVVAVNKDTLVEFKHEQSLVEINLAKAREFYFGTTTNKYTLPETHEDGKTMVLSMVAIDAVCLLLSIVGIILVAGCNKREKYIFSHLLTKRRSRSRSYGAMAKSTSHSIEEAVDV